MPTHWQDLQAHVRDLEGATVTGKLIIGSHSLGELNGAVTTGFDTITVGGLQLRSVGALQKVRMAEDGRGFTITWSGSGGVQHAELMVQIVE